MAEYAAGLVVGQRFPLKTYRIIISKLEIDYHKPGRGRLEALASAPAEWPVPVEGQLLVPMVSIVRNEAGEEVATCRTTWQVKEWSATRSS
jgi:acyl-coenzyme A thioesterase PaaI-like protein